MTLVIFRSEERLGTTRKSYGIPRMGGILLFAYIVVNATHLYFLHVDSEIKQHKSCCLRVCLSVICFCLEFKCVDFSQN